MSIIEGDGSAGLKAVGKLLKKLGVPGSSINDLPHPVVDHAAGYFRVYVGIPVLDFTEHRSKIALDRKRLIVWIATHLHRKERRRKNYRHWSTSLLVWISLPVRYSAS